MPRGISELIKSLKNNKVSKISQQFYETFFEQTFHEDSVSIKEEAELSKEEQFNLHFGSVVLQIGYIRLLSIVTDNVNDYVM